MYEKNGIKYYSPDEKFHFPNVDMKRLKYARHDNNFDYVCPYCNHKVPIGLIACDDGYDVNDKHYPIYCNETLGGTMDGTYHDWEEIHCCPECNKEFVISNGCY